MNASRVSLNDAICCKDKQALDLSGKKEQETSHLDT